MTLFDNIIVPLDGSEWSAQALPAACIMSKASGAPITLLRSFDAVPDWQVDSRNGRYRGSMEIAEYERISALLRAEQQNLEDRGLGVTIEVESYQSPPHEMIIDFANRQPDALIVMSTHGRSGMARTLAGSVTARVVNAVSNPALIVRCNESDCPIVPGRFDNIIVPLDGSGFAERALPFAQELGARFGAKITLIRTTPDSEYFRVRGARADWQDGPGYRYFEPEQLATRLSESARAYLWRKADELSARFPAFDVEAKHDFIAPSDAVIRLADNLDNCLVVMSTHGRRGISRAVFGSVADQVVRNSNAPTLLIRSPNRTLPSAMEMRLETPVA